MGQQQAGYYGRYALGGFNVDDAGVMLALAIPVAWHLAVSPSRCRTVPAFKLVNYVYIPAAVLGIGFRHPNRFGGCLSCLLVHIGIASPS